MLKGNIILGYGENTPVDIRLDEFRVHNFKALRDVKFRPGSLTFVIGPNAGGKSTLLQALEFIGAIFRWGLEEALTRQGGPEAIWHRTAAGPVDEPMRLEVDLHIRVRDRTACLSYRLAFAARETGGTVQLQICDELLSVRASDGSSMAARRDSRNPDVILTEASGQQVSFARYLLPLDRPGQRERFRWFRTVTMWESPFYRPNLRFFPFSSASGPYRRFSLFPVVARQTGIPARAAALGSGGEDLPAVIRWLRADFPEGYQSLRDLVRLLIPSLRDLHVVQTYDRRWGLYVEDENGRWTANEVSDGTLMALAVAVALHDPRTQLVMIEEIENCLHPWIVRRLLQHIRAHARDQGGKQVVLTTHSPLVLNEARGDEVWVAYRRDGSSRVRPLSELSTDDLAELNIGDYLDAGGAPEWLPPHGGVQPDENRDHR